MGKSPRTVAVPTISLIIAGATLAGWKPIRRCLSRRFGFTILTCLHNPHDILAQCKKLRPAVLLLDQGALLSLDPAEFVNLVGPRRSVRVLVKLEEEAPETIERLLRLGCAGFLGPQLKPAMLRRAVVAVTRGELWVSRRLISRMLQDLLFVSPRRLTERETEILDLIGQGCTNQEIAVRLCISRETVRWHQKALYAKLGVRDRISAVQAAKETSARRPPEFLRTPSLLSSGLVSPPPGAA
jgi:DNA-binding NarL/FixJ family response regulator